MVWGYPTAYGVFLEREQNLRFLELRINVGTGYLEDPVLLAQPNAKSLLPLIGTLSSGIMYCSGSVLPKLRICIS
jgi:MFS transporter, MCT family, solute carrier family 16 (monocarboxylic acid transporters), member 10